MLVYQEQLRRFGGSDLVTVVSESYEALDHGVASTMLMAGAVGAAESGVRPDLDELDDDDNPRTDIGFDHYLASLSQDWLGVEAASFLPGKPSRWASSESWRNF